MRHRAICTRLVGFAFAAAAFSAPAAHAQPMTMDELASAVVRIKTYINPDGRTVPTLGPSAKAPASSSTRTAWC